MDKIKKAEFRKLIRNDLRIELGILGKDGGYIEFSDGETDSIPELYAMSQRVYKSLDQYGVYYILKYPECILGHKEERLEYSAMFLFKEDVDNLFKTDRSFPLDMTKRNIKASILDSWYHCKRTKDDIKENFPNMKFEIF